MWKNPISFAISALYERSFADNVSISYPTLPFSTSPTLVVVSGNKQNMQAVTRYGEGANYDEAARKPLDAIKEMSGTENIINMTSKKSFTERKKIKTFLIDSKSLAEVHTLSKVLFKALLENWDKNISFKDHISFCCINVIAQCVLGIPTLTREQASVMTRAGNLLRDSHPGAADFDAGREAMAKLNDELLQLYQNALLTTNNYIQQKANCSQFANGSRFDH